jgi:hypothetical protein
MEPSALASAADLKQGKKRLCSGIGATRSASEKLRSQVILNVSHPQQLVLYPSKPSSEGVHHTERFNPRQEKLSKFLSGLLRLDFLGIKRPFPSGWAIAPRAQRAIALQKLA